MAPTATAERVMRVTEVAEHLDITAESVYLLIRQNRLRAIRVGRAIRVPESALSAFIAGVEPEHA